MLWGIGHGLYSSLSLHIAVSARRVLGTSPGQEGPREPEVTGRPDHAIPRPLVPLPWRWPRHNHGRSGLEVDRHPQLTVISPRRTELVLNPFIDSRL